MTAYRLNAIVPTLMGILAGFWTSTAIAADCNGNGVEDDLDIAFGTSSDCNSNTIPDECELVGNDCDHNFIPDECDAETGTVIFLEQQVQSVQDLPGGVAIGDFDGNGTPDVAVVHRISNNVQVLLNDGSGNLTPGSITSVGSFPIGTVAAYLDDDDDLDIAVANLTGDSISVLSNNGDATFSLVATIPLVEGPWGMTSGDFDGDGDTDLAVAIAITTSAVSIIENLGANTFTVSDVISVGSVPRYIVAFDFDNDEDLDLATSDSGSDQVSVLRNEGDGTFTGPVATIPVGEDPWGIAAADFDGDGFIDLACSSITPDTVSILINNTNGGFFVSQSVLVGLDPQSIIAADVTGEGAPDIVAANLTTGNPAGDVSAVLNTGDGTFAGALNFCSGSGPNAIAAGDLDGDGQPEMVVTNSTDDTISVLVNRSHCVDCDGNGRIDACEIQPYAIGFEASEGYELGNIQGQVGWFRKRILEEFGDPLPMACPDRDVLPVNDVGCGQAVVTDDSPIGSGWALKMFPDPTLDDSDAWAAFSPNMIEPEFEIDIWEWDINITNYDGPDTNVWIQGSCDEAPAAVRLKYQFDGKVMFYDWSAELYVNTFFTWTPNSTVHTKVTINDAIQLVTLEFNGDIFAFTFPQADSGSQELIIENDNFESETGEDIAWIDNISVITIPDCNGNGIDDAEDIANGVSDDVNSDGVPDECQEDCNGNGELDPEDCNNNRVQDECDLVEGTSLDCNGNEIPDECDIFEGTSEDCNGNDIPDECDIAGGETDGNGDGIPDVCQDCNGDGELDPTDCNGNGEFDECDLVTGFSQDCNANEVPDECDIADGLEVDCNENAIPDSCDIADGTSEDADSNGVPDECEQAEPCEGDANGDNVVDPLDSGFVLSRFGCPVGTGDPNCDAADQNGDGVVDPLDVGYVLSRFGECL